MLDDAMGQDGVTGPEGMVDSGRAGEPGIDAGDGGRPDRRHRDPGTSAAAIIAWIALLPLLALVVGIQHTPEKPAAGPVSAVAAPSPMEPISIMAKLAVKLSRVMATPGGGGSGAGAAPGASGSGTSPSPAGGPAGSSGSSGSLDPTSAGMLIGQMDGMALTSADKVRAAIVAGELQGGKEALVRLEKVRSALAEQNPGTLSDAVSTPDAETPTAAPADEKAQQDPKAGADQTAQQDPKAKQASEDARVLDESIRILNTIYETGNAGSLSEADRTFLIDHHAWFGKLALAYGKPDKDPERAALVSGGVGLVLLLLTVGLGIVALVIAGFVMAIVAVVMLGSGKLRPRFVPPAPGGSVYIETVAVFLAAFLGLKGVIWLLERQFGQPEWMGPVQLMLQWAVLPAIFWPVVRGVPWRRLRADMGWYAPRGVWREIGAGVLGYIAGVPIFLLGVLFTLIAMFAKEMMSQAVHGGPGGGGPAAPPDNPIFDLVSKGSPLMIGLLYVLASVWAPIVEEAVFRGAFYRHARGRLPVVVAALGTALVFAFMHGYEVLALGPVFALGFNFALMREWRGSLIAPMTAHALHNGVTLALVIALLSVLG